ncbi:MAG: hypothetical protein K9I71_10945 [Ignavibacteriales bacterium]|nr:hypothetical protein [Melioribacteraceae bacterium]MCF8316636.1 hypothetical protein [Ignavibacteriales bacterium]MCF8438244.1 hypothetical protein [Ignavibacteriales bacterium]
MSIYDKIDLLVDTLRTKLANFDLSALNSMENFSAFIYDKEFKNAEYDILKEILADYDKETAIALMDLIRKRIEDTVSELFGDNL